MNLLGEPSQPKLKPLDEAVILLSVYSTVTG